MAVLLIRHAVAKDRSRWEDDDNLRPLTSRGREQAAALVEQLAGYEITEVRSSPSLRCIDTVVPVAAARSLAVVRDDRLFEGDSTAAIALVRELLRDEASAALCSHGDIVPEVVEALGFRCDRCAKGSTWVLERDAALYLRPPA